MADEIRQCAKEVSLDENCTSWLLRIRSGWHSSLGGAPRRQIWHQHRRTEREKETAEHPKPTPHSASVGVMRPRRIASRQRRPQRTDREDHQHNSRRAHSISTRYRQRPATLYTACVY